MQQRPVLWGSLWFSALAVLLAACGGVPAASPPAGAPSSPPSRPVSAAPVSTAPASAAQPAASAAAAERLGIRYGLLASISNAAMFVPAEAGQFAAQGLDVTIQTFTDTVQIMVSVGSGQLQMGNITLGAAAFNALNRGLDLKILASSTQNPPRGGAAVPAIARADLYDSGALTKPEHLKGRKLAINAKGNILEYSTAKLLALGGLTPSDVEMVYMPFPDMIAALGNKSLDAGLMLEPAGTQAIVKGVGKLLSDDYSPNTQNALMVVNGKFAEQHRDALERLLMIYLQTTRRFTDGGYKRDDQALSIIESYTKVAPDITKRVPDTYWPRDCKANLESLQDQQNYYLSVKSTDYTTPIPLEKYIDYSFLEAALKKLGS